MKKYFLILFCFIAQLFYEQAFSQTVDLNKGFNSLDQAFVYDALKNNVFLIRQEYILQDKQGKIYGRGENNYYGVQHYFGVVSDKVLWCSELVNKPWETDKSAVITPEFTPVLDKIYIRGDESGSFEKIQRTNLKDADQKKLAEHKLYCLYFDKKGVQLKPGHKSANGWAMMAYTEKPVENEKANIKWAIFKRKLNFQGTDNFALIENFPDNIENILGGAFFEPVFSDGEINFMLTGIIQKQVLNWYVYIIPDLDEKPKCKGWFKCWKEKMKKKKQCRKNCMEAM